MAFCSTVLMFAKSFCVCSYGAPVFLEKANDGLKVVFQLPVHCPVGGKEVLDSVVHQLAHDMRDVLTSICASQLKKV